VTAAASPCVSICVIDPVTGFCIGCGRTGEEIGNWTGYSEAEKLALRQVLPARLTAMTSRATRCSVPRRRGRAREA